MHPMNHRPEKGFTLLELLTVLAIIGILAAFALPAYNEYITRSRIMAGTSPLADVRVKMEQFFQDNRSYSNGATCGAALPPDTSTFDYVCVGADLSDTTYTVRANGRGSMAEFSYSINETNTRTTVDLPDGWAGVGGACWVSSKGGC